MIRLYSTLLLIFVLLLAPEARAQTTRTTSGNIAVNGAAVTLTANSTGNGSFQISGTWVGTIVFEASNDNVNWTALSVTPMPVSTVVTSATANGVFTYTGAFQNIRIRSTAWTSGTASVYLLATAAHAGGGGGGTVGPPGPGMAIGGAVTGSTPNSQTYINSSGNLANTANPSNGQLLCGSTGASPVLCNVTAGTNVTVTNGPGSIQIAATGGGGSGTLTNVATTAPLSGGPITITGTISCPTCVTGSSLASGQLLVGATGTAIGVGNLSGDVSTAGSGVTTLAASGVTAGSCGSTTLSCGVTVDAKGRVTAISNNTIAGGGGGSPPAGVTKDVQFNSASAFGADTTKFTYDTPTGTLSLPKKLTITDSAPGAIDMGTGAAPTTPAAGLITTFAHSTDNRLHDINSAGTVGTTVVPLGVSGGQCVNGMNSAGILSTTSCGAAGGNTTSTALTNNFVAKANGANSIVNSLYSDDGTNGAYTGTGGVTAQKFVANGAASGSLTLTNVGGAGFSFIQNVGNPAANVSTTLPTALPAANGLPRVATTAGVESWAALTVLGGGTGQTAYTDGQLLIGNTSTGGLTKATLTAGANVTITNSGGAISIASAAGGGGGFTPTDHIAGLIVTKNAGGNTLDISAGEAYNTSNNSIVVCSAQTAMSAGTLGASQWNQVYVYDSGGGTCAFQVVNNADPPSTTYKGTARQGGTGTNRRWIGSFLTTSASNIFAQDVKETAKNQAETMWLTTTTNAPFRVLSAGSATTATLQSIVGAVPRYAAVLCFIGIVTNSSAAGVVNVYISLDGTNNVGTWSTYIDVPSVSFPTLTIWTPINSSVPNFYYNVANAVNSVYLDIKGYRMVR